MKYEIWQGYWDDFKKVAVVVEKNDKVLFFGLNDKAEELYGKIGYGEKSYTPNDGQEYINALIDTFRFSSTVAIKRVEEDVVSKGGPGSGSWESPGNPRFQHQGKKREEPKSTTIKDGKFEIEFSLDREETEMQLQELKITTKQIQNLCDLKESARTTIAINSVFNGIELSASWHDKDNKRIGKFEVYIEDEHDVFGTPKRAEIQLLKADDTQVGLKKFYRDVEPQLKAMKIKEVQLCADITIGRYFWAKEGYNFLKRREFLVCRDKMKEFAKRKLMGNKVDRNISSDVIKQIDKIKNPKEMAEFDCGLLLKASSWKIVNEDVKGDMVLHLGKAFMLDKSGMGVGTWDAIKKIR